MRRLQEVVSTAFDVVDGCVRGAVTSGSDTESFDSCEGGDGLPALTGFDWQDSGVVARRVDGRWYLSPVRTGLAALVRALEAVESETVEEEAPEEPAEPLAPLELATIGEASAPASAEGALARDVCEVLTLEIEPDRIFTRVLQHAAAAVGAPIASIHLIENETGELVLEREYEARGGGDRLRLERTRGLTGNALQTGLLVATPDPEADPRFEADVDTPADGEVLWSQKVRAFRGMNILTPQPYKDSVFISAYGGRAHRFDVTSTGEALEAREAWNNRAQGNMTSPVVIGNHAYLYLRAKRFACVDLDSGEEVWRSSGMTDEYWSLVAQGERLLALTEAGELHLIQHNAEDLQIIDTMTISEGKTWAHLCVDGGQLIVREQDGLVAYSWK